MDAFSVVMILIVMFLAMNLGITWLWIALFLLLIIFSRRLGIIAATAFGIIAIYVFNLTHFWFVVLGILILITFIAYREKPSEEEYITPEMLQYLMMYGGQ